MTLLAHFDAKGAVLNVWHSAEAIVGQIRGLAAALPGLAYGRWPGPQGLNEPNLDPSRQTDEVDPQPL